jgi:hypothetical protein
MLWPSVTTPSTFGPEHDGAIGETSFNACGALG